MINFTSSVDDLSTDRANQFEFSRDTRHDGLTSRSRTSVTWTAAAKRTYSACGRAQEGTPRMCPECGNKMPTWQ